MSKYYFSYSSLFNVRKNIIRAVDNISFKVYEGDIFSIIGETGCGKSTLSKLILGLTNKTSGEILYKGDILNYNLKKLNLRKKIQIVFQDPYYSLNPKKKICKVHKYKIIYKHKNIYLKSPLEISFSG